MKTKSKRFLNLATLCLALLGTTLLMGQPVKAEVGEGSDKSKVQQKQIPYEKSPYEKGVTDGHDAGYKLGKQHRQQNGSSDASPTPPDRAPEPERNPYETDDDKRKYKSGWDTMYIPGYYNGWYEGTGYLGNADNQSEEEGEDEDISGNSSSQG
ncbi:TPA: hypothetical protein ACGOGQ_001759, partial [Streptococcus pyogenes]